MSEFRTGQQTSPSQATPAEQPTPETPQIPTKPSLLARIKQQKRMVVRISSIVLLILIVGGIVLYNIQVRKEAGTQPVDQQDTASSTLLQGEMPKFAEFQIEEVQFTPSLPSYSLETSQIANLKAIEEDRGAPFTPQQLQALEQQGFFLETTRGNKGDPDSIVPPELRIDDLVDRMRKFGGNQSQYFREPKDSVFVSTDLLLHVYHSFIDKLFQHIEETKFHPMLKSLSRSLFERSLSLYNQAQSPEQKESLMRVTAYFLIPSVLLEASLPKTESFGSVQQEEYLSQDETADNKTAVLAKLESDRERLPDEIYESAQKELALLMDARAVVSSPLYGVLRSEADLSALEDYTQYKPRSHYNKNSILRSYFRAVMWYGRQSFVVKSPKLTQDAVYMTWLLNEVQVDGKPAVDSWENIYLPTVFFVGRSDDLSFYEYSNLLNNVYGQQLTFQKLAEPQKLAEFHEQAKDLPGPQILSEILMGEKVFEMTKEELLAGTKSFRFLGQRFTPDSYLFSRLTQGDEKPDPETGQKLPSTPTALMIMSILGSETADEILDEWVADNAPQSDKVIAKEKGKLKTEFEKLTEVEWTKNIYWTWLYTIKSLFQDFGKGYPMFMQRANWAKKGLSTALGSWTELRHDTLLYAKQSYAELGGGMEPPPLPPVPKGYVEPNIAFFERIIALSKMTREGLRNLDLLGAYARRVDAFVESLEFLQGVAVKELNNQEISDDEYEKLRTIGYQLAEVLMPLEGDLMRERDARAGIIADVHTDGKKEQILYEATGTPLVIYVAVKDKGGTRLTRGTTYSYYEFTAPLGERLTDEQWQARVYQGVGELPARPGWVGDLLK